MGYYMSQRETVFSIKKEDFPQVITAIKAMWDAPEKMHGGSSTGEKWYSWCSNPSEYDQIKEVLECMRWSPQFDDDGNIEFLEFQGEKLGDDLQLFEAIAPYVAIGSYIIMDGEDGYAWGWVFKNEECIERGVERDVIIKKILE